MIDPHWGNVVLAMPMAGPNGSTVFTDLKGKTVTRYGDAVITTSQYKFWGSSGAFGGTINSPLSTPDHQDFEFGSGNFNIDTYFRVSSLPSGSGYYRTIFSHDDTAYTRGFLLLISGDDSNKLMFGAFSDATNFTVKSIDPIQVNTWTQARVDREGNYLNLYINDVLQQSTYIGTAAINDVPRPFIVGGLLSGGALNPNASFHGNLNDLRVTKGIARGVEGSSFLLSTYLPSGSAEVSPAVERVEAVGTTPIVGTGQIVPMIESVAGSDGAVIASGEVAPPLETISASGTSQAEPATNHASVVPKLESISGYGSTSVVGFGSVVPKRRGTISASGVSGEWVGDGQISPRLERISASGGAPIIGRAYLEGKKGAVSGSGSSAVAGTGRIIGRAAIVTGQGFMGVGGAVQIQPPKDTVSGSGTSYISGSASIIPPKEAISASKYTPLAHTTLNFSRGPVVTGGALATPVEPFHFSR